MLNLLLGKIALRKNLVKYFGPFHRKGSKVWWSKWKMNDEHKEENDEENNAFDDPILPNSKTVSNAVKLSRKTMA